MKYAAIILAFGAAVVVGQQGDCSPDLDTNAFTFQTMNVTSNSKRSFEEQLLEKRQSITCGASVELHLGGSVLNDAAGRTGYIASNDQFQFDGPPQAGYKQTSGFGVCTLTPDNQRLALDGREIFFNCLSGTFNNIYITKQGEQCYEVYIQVFPCIPKTQIPTMPINSVPFPSGTLSTGSVASVSEAPESSPSHTVSMMVMTAQPMTSTPSMLTAATPYPAGNSSSAAVTASAPLTPVTSSPPAGTAPAPSSFTGAANVLAAGQKLVGMVAGVAAFAMF